MTVADVKRIALQLANTYWVRYFLCLNYPHEPQDVCISVMDNSKKLKPRGTARHDRLLVEMDKLGFVWTTKYGITGFHATVTPPVIERTTPEPFEPGLAEDAT